MSSQQPFNVISNDQQSSTLHCSSRGRDLQIICPSANGEVQHIQKLSDHIGALFLNDEYSDVSLVVEGQSFRAHKVILAARSGKECRIILPFTYGFFDNSWRLVIMLKLLKLHFRIFSSLTIWRNEGIKVTRN